MDHYPLFLTIRDERCLIVGGGEVALRKATMLARAGARCDFVAPDVDDAVRALADESGGTVALRAFESSDVVDARLVIAATDDGDVNRAVHAAARAARVLVNVVDTPALCDFIVPSVVDRTPIVVALSSGGRAPVLLRLLREQLEGLLPGRLGALATLAGAARDRVKRAIPDEDRRRRLWERVLEGPVAEAAVGGREARARALLDEEIAAAVTQGEAERDGAPLASDARGEVWLVGAGPGDPDLLTLRALRLMQRADVVFHDNLVSAPILERVRRDARRVYVGKRRGEHAVPQDRINELLVEEALAGRRVLRLKGGDPFVFGRGGEEIATLHAAGVDFQVVPGITAANGCAAYAGIPLTHRDHAQSVRFVTGHLKNGLANLRWPELAQPGQTLVVYMGLVALAELCARLVEHGRAPDTPVALVEAGTLPEQRVLVATLATLPATVAHAAPRAPTLLIVGEVVSLRDTLAWREDRRG